MLNDCIGTSSQLPGWNNSLPHFSPLAINARICGASVPSRPQMKMRFVSFCYIDTLCTCIYVCVCVCVWGALHRVALVKSLSVSDPRWVMIWPPPGASSFPCSFPCKINELFLSLSLPHTHTHTHTYIHIRIQRLRRSFPSKINGPSNAANAIAAKFGAPAGTMLSDFHVVSANN